MSLSACTILLVCSACPVLLFLFFQSCSVSSFLPVLLCLSHSACPVLPFPFCLFCSACPVADLYGFVCQFITEGSVTYISLLIVLGKKKKIIIAGSFEPVVKTFLLSNVEFVDYSG
jgi:hypothetical protein